MIVTNRQDVFDAIDRLSTIGDPNGSVYMNYLQGDKVRDDDVKLIRKFVEEHGKEGYIQAGIGESYCSCCGQVIVFKDHYCWNCGAKLIGRECVVT